MKKRFFRKKDLRKIFKKREKSAHKYDFGYVIVVGGSSLYTGSPAFGALAALRSGADLTLVIAPKRSADIIAGFSPDLICYPLNCDDISLNEVPTILSLIEGAKRVSQGKVSLLIGGGLGRDKKTLLAVREILKKIDIPAVVDADALYAIEKEKEIIKEKKFILTPHLFEFFVISGKNLKNFPLEKKIEETKKFAQDFKTTILLKGKIDIITDGKEVILNRTGCPEMTVGGTGDVLAGICACFLAQKIPPLLAGAGAAFVNGKAGEKSAQKKGAGLLASDLIEEIPQVIKIL